MVEDVADSGCHSHPVAGTVLVERLGCSAEIDYVGHIVERVHDRNPCNPDPAVVAVLGWRSRMRLVELESDNLCLRLHIDRPVSYSALEEAVELACCSWSKVLVVVELRHWDWGCCAAFELLAQARRVWNGDVDVSVLVDRG